MKKIFGLLLLAASFSAVAADDVNYECSFNAKVETVKTNIFGGSPRTVSTAEFNPCQSPTIPSVVKANGEVSLSECGVFTNDINFGLTVRTQKISEKTARMELIHLDRQMDHHNDYKLKDLIGEKIVDIGKEVVIEAKTKIDFYKKSRRVKEVITGVSVLCLKK